MQASLCGWQAVATQLWVWGLASLHKCCSGELSCNHWCPHASDSTGYLYKRCSGKLSSNSWCPHASDSTGYLYKRCSGKLSSNSWCPHASDSTGCLKDLSQCTAALLLLPILLHKWHPMLLQRLRHRCEKRRRG